MMHAKTASEVLARRKAFVAKWKLRCRPVATRLEEAGERLFTYRALPARAVALGEDNDRH